ncbi:MAG: hypothetical protein A2044_04410 [Candidatus Firestonebacteria bacterium GWA2_43_8]|nr:MAG: hypothetical protein A2044_04410 [Candidatus Firestonebacteria bacterium GWA2_43_8]
MMLFAACIILIFLLRISLSVLIYKGSSKSSLYFDFTLAGILLAFVLFSFYKYLANFPVRYLTDSYISASHDISLKIGRFLHINNYYLSDTLFYSICFLILLYSGYKKKKEKNEKNSK